MHSAQLWFVCGPQSDLASPLCAFCRPAYPSIALTTVSVMSLALLCVCMSMRARVHADARFYVRSVQVTSWWHKCVFSLSAARRDNRALERTHTHSDMLTCLREGPRSLDGCHYTAYHQNVRMGLKAAAVEQVDSGCLSDNRLNSGLLTPPRVSDRLLAEYCCANAADAKSTVITDLFQTTGMGIENASID